MKILRLEETSSTNDYCKAHDDGEDVIVIAKRQTSGRGTKGRSFISDVGGLYVTVMRHYDNFPAENAFSIMVTRTVAVCKTLEKFGVKPVIRWANDVLVGGRKICGTLIENTFSNGYITRSIVGSGININNPLPKELKEIAISAREILGKKLPLLEVEKEFIQNALREYTVEDYKGYIDWLGKRVTLKTDEGERVVTALDIAPDGRLIADWCGNMLEISSAEVSLKL